MLLQSGGSIGPAIYIDDDEDYAPYFPVILYEPDFTQAIADNGYKFVSRVSWPYAPILFADNAILDVVGLWNVDGYVPPLAPTLEGLRREASPLSLREAALAATANFRRPQVTK